MKLLLVSPPFGEGGQKSKGLPIAPPVLEYLAGLTLRERPEVELTLLDANKEPLVPEAIEADLVGFTVLTPQAPWVYRMADRLRALGRRVVLGGIHVTTLPQEAVGHADALVVGEAERSWKRLLRDAQKGRLKPVYTDIFPPLEHLPKPLTHLWKASYVYGYFFTARGCPYSCNFCSVHRFYGSTVRYRPIQEVIEEVAQSRRRLFWNIDDNIWGGEMNRYIELYGELARNISRKWWFGSGDLASVQNSQADQLLTTARKAGLTAALVGWESNNLLSLEEYNACSKQGQARQEAIRRIRNHGIEVMLFIMVGGRQDTRADFEEILQLCDRLKVSAHPVMTTPFPGTALYELYKPYLIPGLDWDRYTGNHAVFYHPDPDMAVEEREGLLLQLRSELFTLPRILRRIPQISLRGFPMAHLTSWMIQYPQGRAFKQYAKNWRKELGRHPDHAQ